ncbi:SusC/RagA family TonB-linked outer membrane protein [Paraflavisolibacter sp. H34]|uniref:SusC/RagA family TonB-linked outer membrane protein n=1 Tax=Huijunlia imazamoxiresistens TaxID=3127457 RepID=UPI00301757E7
MKRKWAFKKPAKMLVSSLLYIGLGMAAYGQTAITGKVLDKKDNKPVVGATVQVKNSPEAAMTDENGNFTLKVANKNATLEISYVGFAKQEIRINSQGNVAVYLEEGSRAMDDVVVIGYQSVQRRNATAAISTVKGKDFENVPYPTFDQMLQGRVAGLNILSISGEPGANNIVNIRGNTSVDAASGNGISTPLYVIDGVVFDVSDVRSAYGNANPLQAINPNDIESVDVLKDASAAAIYGARAANGVIIIKTKRPKGGRPQFRVSAYAGLSTKPAMKPVLVGADERRKKMDLLKAGGTYTQLGGISQFLTDSLNPAFNNNVDWQGLFLRNALIKNVDLNIGAAEERFAYRISLNRYQEDGIMRGYSLTRSTPRLFLSVKPYKGIEVTSDLYVGLTKATHGPGNGNIYPFTVSNFPSSFWQITDEVKKNYEGRNEGVRDDDRTTSVNGNTRLIATLLPKLTFTSSLSYNYNFGRRDYLRHRSVTTNNRSDAIHSSSNSRRWEIENYLTYTKEINDHTFTGLIGQGVEENTINSTNIQANGIPFDAIQMVQGVPAGPSLSASTFFEDRSRVSAFARVGYDYKGKYGVDGSYRRDASSRYSKDSRWGSFPAVSARWNVSEEPFFDRFRSLVSFLKLRASYGLTGRDPGGYYEQYRQLITDVRYAGSSLGSGAAGNVITYNGTTAVTPNYGAAAPAANISWEKTPQSNFGLDAGFFKDRITLAADYYIKDSRELVFNIPVPTTTGYTTAKNNYVDVRNQGVELTLTTRNLAPKSSFRWNTTFNIAFNQNMVTKLPAGNRDFVFGQPWLQRTLTIGQPLYGFLAWDIPQIYPSVDDVPVDPLTGQRVKWFGGNMFGAGDGAKRDVNGDYNIENIDKINMGDPQTRVYGGIINQLGYKGFNVSVLCTFIQGRKLWNGYLSDKLNGSASAPFTNWGPNSGPAADFGGLDFWRNTGDKAYFPSLFGNNIDKWHIAQSMFIEDASFFRIKNVNLSYAFPEKVAKRLRLKGLSVYSVMDNLRVFYNATVPDPELVSPDGYTNGNDYPLPKKFTFGLDVQF